MHKATMCNLEITKAVYFIFFHLDKSTVQVFYWYFIATNNFLKEANIQLLLRPFKMLRMFLTLLENDLAI